MKKVERIQALLDRGSLPRDVAREVGCALSLVYEVRGKRDMALIKQSVTELQRDLVGIRQRLDQLAVGYLRLLQQNVK
jgi:hypothetical protein